MGVDYMKSKSANYVQVEQEMWKPIHQSRVDAGELLGWYLYQITWKGISGDPQVLTRSEVWQLLDFVQAAPPEGN